jgi:hypothetical protein
MQCGFATKEINNCKVKPHCLDRVGFRRIPFNELLVSNITLPTNFRESTSNDGHKTFLHATTNSQARVRTGYLSIINVVGTITLIRFL